jgi:alpha,alpha-trehalase
MNPRYQPVLEHIDALWSSFVRHNPADVGTLIGLEQPYLVPAADGAMFQEMYYWDSYFMALGLEGTTLEDMIPGLVSNLAQMLRRFFVIPNGSRFYFTSRSQPPFFTQLVWLAYGVKRRRGDADLEMWLADMLEAAIFEQETVWRGTKQPHDRLHSSGLSRYFDINYLSDLACCESGWDHSTRCDDRWLDHLPVDLNSILYVCELDIARMADALEKPDVAQLWRARADQRAETVRTMLWDEARGFFYDFDFANSELNPHASLAGFYPLWAGIATPEQAARAVRDWLPRFLQPGGLVTTLEAKSGRQWAWPNAWAPLQLLVSDGLERCGFLTEARDVRERWCNRVADVFERTGALWEKYDVVTRDASSGHAEEGVYGQVKGFGWTNAVFKVFTANLEQNS